ncbi:unnamed protein product [Caenorhabditis bovis]|uniref:tRNA (guanine-N(7)-)-methyltransferase non-catalytic subunit n=1 Tax=Caenorhabditis bovis TaxID=2654633 RepID=A0A8S1EXI7_9PELO|nr:unnamed protein product [Caenorhabditis bovis]
MSFVVGCGENVIIASGSIIANYEHSTGKMNTEFFKWESVEEKNIVQTTGEEEDEEKKPQKKAVDDIVVLCISTSGSPNNLLAIGTNEKLLHILKISDDGLTAKHIIAGIVPKAPTSCVFDKENAHVIIGDRAGEVHKMEIATGKVVEIAGAISMILDVGLSTDGKHLILADRDEKIRILRYPESFVIENICLGHTEYVKSIAFQSNGTIWSGGGDGHLRHWNMTTVKPLNSKQIFEEKNPLAKVLTTPDEKHVIVTVENSAKFCIVNTETYDVSVDSVSDEPIIDIFSSPKYLLILTKTALVLYDPNNYKKEVALDGDLAKSVAETRPALGNLFKNVTYNNQEEYEKRKSEKFAKVEEKRALKRKAAQ